MSKRHVWSKRSKAKVIKLWKDGERVKDIAKAVNKPVTAVSSLIYRLRMSGEIESRAQAWHKDKKSAKADKKMGPKAIKEEINKHIVDSLNKGPYPNYPFPAPKKRNPKMVKRGSTAHRITETCDEIRELLLKKNKAYGDSAFAPIRIFSKSDSSEQLKVRIDDKLNRLLQGDDSIEADEDIIKDLIGYLVLLLINMRE